MKAHESSEITLWIVFDELPALADRALHVLTPFDTKFLSLRGGWFGRSPRTKTKFPRLVGTVLLAVSAFAATVRQFQPRDRVLIAGGSQSGRVLVAFAALLRGSVYSLLVDNDYSRALAASRTVGKSRLGGVLFAFSNRWLFKHGARILVIDSDADLVRTEALGLNVPITDVQTETESPAAFARILQAIA